MSAKPSKPKCHMQCSPISGQWSWQDGTLPELGLQGSLHQPPQLPRPRLADQSGHITHYTLILNWSLFLECVNRQCKTCAGVVRLRQGIPQHFVRPRALPGEGAHRRVALHVLLAPPRLPAIAKPGMNHDALARSKYVRGRKTLDSYEFRSSLISPYKFKLLGSYESSGYPLQMGV